MLYRILDFRLPIFGFEILEQFEPANFENMSNQRSQIKHRE
jgi:hypothetical protein